MDRITKLKPTSKKTRKAKKLYENLKIKNQEFFKFLQDLDKIQKQTKKLEHFYYHDYPKLIEVEKQTHILSEDAIYDLLTNQKILITKLIKKLAIFMDTHEDFESIDELKDYYELN